MCLDFSVCVFRGKVASRALPSDGGHAGNNQAAGGGEHGQHQGDLNQTPSRFKGWINKKKLSFEKLASMMKGGRTEDADQLD